MGLFPCNKHFFLELWLVSVCGLADFHLEVDNPYPLLHYKHVMAMASEAEITALFYGCKHGIPLKISIEEMGHYQPPTLVTTDNSTITALTSKHPNPLICGGTGSNADKHTSFILSIKMWCQQQCQLPLQTSP